MSKSIQRVCVYVDGFNLYFGMRSKFGNPVKWLNIYKLAESMLRENQEIQAVKFFTAHIKGTNKQKITRQNSYLSALGTTPVKIIKGQYQVQKTRCKQCRKISYASEEKMTDVNIAVHMLTDAIEDNYDTAILVSGDSDLTPALAALRKYFPEKQIILAFSPNRKSKNLLQYASTHFVLGKQKLLDAQFEVEIPLPNGYILRRPKAWQEEE
jgi:uncharacterized LabA/DUF88 family protein